MDNEATAQLNEEILNLSMSLVTAVINEDFDATSFLLERMTSDQRGWVALSLAALVGEFIGGDAEQQGSDAAQVWREALSPEVSS